MQKIARSPQKSMVSPEDKLKKPIESTVKESPKKHSVLATPSRTHSQMDQVPAKLSKAEKSEKRPAEKDEKLLGQITRHLAMIDQFE